MPDKTMKTLVNVSVLAVLLVVAPSRCSALMEIEFVSKERAKELGIELRLKPNGPNDVWVELEFKAEGELKGFSHVSLEIREGDKLLLGWARLREERLDSGSIVIHFLANRAYLDKITLSVVEGVPTAETGHELRVKDFVPKEMLQPIPNR